MSVISGYPMGAKLTTDFYELGLINKVDAQKIMSFCSTSGPLFVIGSVGVGFFANSKFGILLFLTHILSSILNGFLYRNLKDKKNKTFITHDNSTLLKNKKNISSQNNNLPIVQATNSTLQTNNSFSLEDAMFSTIKSLLIVGGYIVIFYTLIEILLDLNILSPIINLLSMFGFNKIEATGLVSGLVEITKGISILSQTHNIKTAFILSSTIISFSGISIFIQSLTFLNKLKINKKLFLLQKTTHAIITLFVSIVLSFVLF